GEQEASWPVEPYDFLLWWHCGYPASDARCQKGWDKLKREVGIEPATILAASQKKLVSVLKAGGIIPEMRAERLKQVAMRVHNQFSGDLNSVLCSSIAEARKILKKFPGIADPGADRILLFGGISPIAAIPSNATHVLVRILDGREHENYRINYQKA